MQYFFLFSWHWKVKSEIIIIFIERTVFIKVFNCVRRIRKIYITEITCILLKWLKQRNKNSTRACVITLLPIWCHVSRLKEVSQAFFNEKFIWCNNKDLGNTSTGQHHTDIPNQGKEKTKKDIRHSAPIRWHAFRSLFDEHLIDYDRSQWLWFWKSRRFAKMFKGGFGWFTTDGTFNAFLQTVYEYF